MANSFLSCEEWKSLLEPKKPMTFHRLVRKPQDELATLQEEFKDMAADLEKIKREGGDGQQLPGIKEKLMRRKRILEHLQRLSLLSKPKPRSSTQVQPTKWSWADPLDPSSGPGTYEVSTPLGKPHPLSTVPSPPIALFPKTGRDRMLRETRVPSPGFYNPNVDAVLRQSETVIFPRSSNPRSITPSFPHAPASRDLTPKTDRSESTKRQYSFPKAKRVINVKYCKDYSVARANVLRGRF